MTANYWPPHLPRSLPATARTLNNNLFDSAARFGDRHAIEFFGASVTYRRMTAEVEAIAAWLKRAGVKRGDRVVLYLQNSPQWLIAYHAILRADAVVTPLNPMNRAIELARYLKDCGARVAIAGQDLAETLISAAAGADLTAVLLAAYSDYLGEDDAFALPDWLTPPAITVDSCTSWNEALACTDDAGDYLSTADDIAILPYTSGSTGVPKGCPNTHRAFMHTTTGLSLWHGQTENSIFLAAPPMYQVSGLAHSVNCPILVGGTIVPVPRWNRDLALRLMQRYRVTHAAIASTAVIDLLAEDFGDYDLSSVTRITSGGAPMPAAVWRRLQQTLGLPFIEAYGMTETAATTHINPIERPKPQCLGVAFFDTIAKIIDTETVQEKAQGEAGEIVVSGPQIFNGYWNQPEATREAFITIDGRRFYRTGDIGYADEEGYFFALDRLKRMINASGYKVWPAEVEAALYEHPAVSECCVISAKDSYRGETVKALIVLRPEFRGAVTTDDIVKFAKGRMSAFKYPRIVEFVDALPKNQTGKILWRDLQDAENAASQR